MIFKIKKETLNNTVLILKDIQHCLDNNILFGALCMSLILPDICGKIEYPSEKPSQRYKKWFNEYCSQYFNPFKDIENTAKSVVFDAETCYLLRCAILHSSETDISKDINIDSFNLIFKSGNLENPLFESSPITEESDKSYMNINVALISRYLLASAAQYIKDRQ